MKCFFCTTLVHWNTKSGCKESVFSNAQSLMFTGTVFNWYQVSTNSKRDRELIKHNK